MYASTPITGIPASASAFCVPPVESNSTPRLLRARAKSIKPVLSETEIRARRIVMGWHPGNATWVVSQPKNFARAVAPDAIRNPRVEPALDFAKGSRCNAGAVLATVTGNEATTPLGEEPGKALQRVIRQPGNLAIRAHSSITRNAGRRRLAGSRAPLKMTEIEMKHVRMLGLVVAIAFTLTAGCDDNSAVGAAGTGGAGGNASDQTGGTGAGGSSSVPGTGGASTAGTSASGTTPEADSGTLDLLPEIAGDYSDGYQTHKISRGTWQIDTSVFHITVLDNEKEFLVASNDPNNDYFPGKWSRFDWTRNAAGDLYYCQTAYDAETQQAAENTARPNPQDLTSGCGSFAWTKLVPIGAADAGF